jgi:hypothetical protein
VILRETLDGSDTAIHTAMTATRSIATDR